MTQEEAIEVYNGLINTKIKEAFEFFVPELPKLKDEKIRKALIQYLKDYPSNLPNGLYSRDDFFTYLEKHKESLHISESCKGNADSFTSEQKPAECLKAERNGWYICIKDFYGGGKKQCAAGELVQAKGGMYMMCREDISPWFRKAYYEEVQNAFEPNAKRNV